MNTYEEDIVYDAMIAIQKNSEVLAKMVNANNTTEARKAYKDGVSAPCIKLQLLLGTDALKRGNDRYE